jgi:tetratricopeptide (TPR) repeat protein
MTGEKTCFVVQGFGEKTDLTNGRKLNLDASYEVIREAVEEAGLQCIRADQIVHSGTIDEPMYNWLYSADLVIADLSTYNINAAYELGVRYGVRPAATIILAEDQFKSPFDVNHIVIRRYKHLGDDIGAQEARKLKKELSSAIKQIVAEGKTDSPFYSLLRLNPPSAGAPATAAGAPPSGPASGNSGVEQNAKQLLDVARAAMTADNFESAITLFRAVHALRPRDEYAIQQLALATYKCKQPDPLSALKEAHALLQMLTPETTNDPETLGLWGAVHKRLWDITSERKYLEESITAYERGFYLKQDYYNGINLAYLLNVRAALQDQAGERADAIADFVLARRVRRDVVKSCEIALAAPPSPKTAAADRYWICATLWEAWIGLEDASVGERWRKEAEEVAAAAWMVETTRSQLVRLNQLLAASPLKALAGS